MISIIICSRSVSPPQLLLTNIEKTIGVPYEVISIDNSTNKYSICGAYNLGVKSSRYEILCFMHDDIEYHTSNWGNIVADHFNDKALHAIGIAGTPYLSAMPGAWWGSGIIYENLVHEKGSQQQLPGYGSKKVKEIVAFDGLWFCIRKSLFEQIAFDELNFTGFHFYDIDISMQIHNLNVKMYCITDVFIKHLSFGNLDDKWIESLFIFQKKWKNKLPALCINVSFNESRRFEYKTLNGFIQICANNNWSNKKIYYMALKFLLKLKKGYLFYKTPGYFIKFLFKMLFKKGAPFYSI